MKNHITMEVRVKNIPLWGMWFLLTGFIIIVPFEKIMEVYFHIEFNVVIAEAIRLLAWFASVLILLKRCEVVKWHELANGVVDWRQVPIKGGFCCNAEVLIYFEDGKIRKILKKPLYKEFGETSIDFYCEEESGGESLNNKDFSEESPALLSDEEFGEESPAFISEKEPRN